MEGNTLSSDLLHGSTSKVSVGRNEEGIISIIGRISLIIELHIVPIDQVTNLLMDVSISLLGVKSVVGKVGGLRSVSNNVLSDR